MAGAVNHCSCIERGITPLNWTYGVQKGWLCVWVRTADHGTGLNMEKRLVSAYKRRKCSATPKKY